MSDPDLDKRLAAVLEGCIARLMERDDKRLQCFEETLLAALKPGTPTTDPKNSFRNVYKKVSDEHDNELQEKYTGNLDASLIFAGLFSAVSSAFIIEIQSDLKPDPADTVQALLRIIAHSVNSSAVSGVDLTIPEWNGPPSGVVVVESILYASLFATLLAAFLAVLGKQWLSYYSSVGMKGTIAERGLERQRKFDGFHRWGFASVMEALPILLQLALLLFAAAISEYLWALHRTIGIIVLTLTAFGMSCYIFFAVSAIHSESSPFRTPISDLILRVFPPAKNSALLPEKHFLRTWDDITISSTLNSSGGDGVDPLASKVYDPTDPKKPRESQLLSQKAQTRDSPQCAAAIMWILETSTDPDVVSAAASAMPEIQWPAHMDVTASLDRLANTFFDCFQDVELSTIPPLVERRAIDCGKAYYHLYFHQPGAIIDFRFGWFSALDRYWWDVCNWSPELKFVHNLLDRLEHANSSFNRMDKRQRLRSVGRWPGWTEQVIQEGKFDILAQQIYYFDGTMEQMTKMEEFAFKVEVVNAETFTNWILCIGLCCGVRIHPHDLAVFEKRTHADTMLQEVLNHITLYLGNVKSPATISSLNMEKLRLGLGTIITLLGKLEPSEPVRIEKPLWSAIFMYMAVTRFTGNVEEFCKVITEYFKKKSRGDVRFLHPQWSDMADDFWRCGLSSILEEVPRHLYLIDKRRGSESGGSVGYRFRHLQPS